MYVMYVFMKKCRFIIKKWRFCLVCLFRLKLSVIEIQNKYMWCCSKKSSVSYVVSAGSVWVVQGESCQHGLVAQTSLSLSGLNSEMNNEAELWLSYIKIKPCSTAFVLCSNQWENDSEHVFMLQNTIQFLRGPLNVVSVIKSGWIITEIH